MSNVTPTTPAPPAPVCISMNQVATAWVKGSANKPGFSSLSSAEQNGACIAALQIALGESWGAGCTPKIPFNADSTGFNVNATSIQPVGGGIDFGLWQFDKTDMSNYGKLPPPPLTFPLQVDPFSSTFSVTASSSADGPTAAEYQASFVSQYLEIGRAHV